MGTIAAGIVLRIKASPLNVFRVFATSDELYLTTVRVLTVFRNVDSVSTPAGFRECLGALQEYVDVRCDEDKKRLAGPQRVYLQTVRERCLATADRVCEIIDRLVPALNAPDLERARDAYGELDSVFRPPDGGVGWDVMKRAADSS